MKSCPVIKGLNTTMPGSGQKKGKVAEEPGKGGDYLDQLQKFPALGGKGHQKAPVVQKSRKGANMRTTKKKKRNSFGIEEKG